MSQIQRRLPFERVHNFRDFGGYVGAGSRKVTWGALYRSAQLSGMTESDKLRFLELGVELVFDFRRDDERLREPTPLESASAELISLAITPGSAEGLWSDVARGRATALEMVRLMEAINRDLVLNQTAIYRRVFDQLLQGRRRILIHCAAGKDRTGVAAALILSALGVDRETIMQDYLLTNQYLPLEQELERMSMRMSQAAGAVPAAEVLRPVLEARESYLAAAFAAIDENFGSVAAYLDQQLGLGDQQIQQLQEGYLQSAE